MMDKLISQQAAIDVLKELTANGTNKGMVFGEDAVHRIEILPSVQPDIIRCKDCKWYGRADRRRFYRGMDCLQKRIDTIVPDRDFCSKAERREE